MLYVALYVDDSLMVGNLEADKVTEASNGNGLALKVVERLQEYLSCEVRFLSDKKRD